jgi:hypothetical protein
MRHFLCLVLAAGPWWISCRAPSSTSSGADGYWSVTCLSGDGRYLLAGGDHAALVDAATGAVKDRVPSMVAAVGCDQSGGVVVGYGTAFRLPGRAAAPVPPLGGDGALAMSQEGVWISSGRSMSGGKWRGPAMVFVTRGQDRRRVDLLPDRFGPVGAARALPLADSFAVRFGSLLQDGRLLLAAGWEPSRNAGSVEDLPWAFFAWDLTINEASPLTGPVHSDRAINQAWVQRIASTPDAAHLVIATHDGERLSIGRFERDANRASRVVSLASQGGPSALALSNDGTLVAVGSESRGRDAPGQAWLLDEAGRVAWNASFEKRVAGIYFLPDGSLIIAAGEGKAIKVPGVRN